MNYAKQIAIWMLWYACIVIWNHCYTNSDLLIVVWKHPKCLLAKVEHDSQHTLWEDGATIDDIHDIWIACGCSVLSANDETAVNIDRSAVCMQNQTTMYNSRIVYVISGCSIVTVYVLRIALCFCCSVFLYSNIVFPQCFSPLHFSIAILGNIGYDF